MGLTISSVGLKAVDPGLSIRRQKPDDKVTAFAGNPNVGKSTLFNALTGMNQHTGNWPGKTVTNAQGRCSSEKHSYICVDIPGTYSLMAHSAEEEVARDFICFGDTDAVIVVCDATCLERNLNLVLQTMEVSSHVIVCVNLLDEARRKRIRLDLPLLSERLGVPVVGTVARKKKTLTALLSCLDDVCEGNSPSSPLVVTYPEAVEYAVSLLEPAIRSKTGDDPRSRFFALRMLEGDESLNRELSVCFGFEFHKDPAIKAALAAAIDHLLVHDINADRLRDLIVASLLRTAEDICDGAVHFEKTEYNAADRRIDRFLTSRRTGYPAMLLLLALVFWLTIVGANYPSALLSAGLFWIQNRLTDLFMAVHAPEWLHGVLVLGIYRVVAWVVSVMLPPMAIFFPLFTLLEDAGYLPRIAYNLDKPFQRCHACGKQALTMCMGFGCNAAGIVGCRIIDSPRERLLAILTNNFVPCNGRFPTLIALLTMFFVGSATDNMTDGAASSGGGSPILTSLRSALLLTAVILTGILVTFAVTKFLSRTLLSGVPSSFTLELPPYRKPQIGRILIRSVFDRTLFVLGRAVAVAAPAGLILWLLANVTVADVSLLRRCADFLDPFAKLLGMDGVILIAFILGFPANEIVLPIILMAYMAQGSLLEPSSLPQMKQLLVDNGWTVCTAVSVMLFSLMHWPCSTTLLTIKKETGSLKWTVFAALLPTVIGIAVCMLFNVTMRAFGVK